MSHTLQAKEFQEPHRNRNAFHLNFIPRSWLSLSGGIEKGPESFGRLLFKGKTRNKMLENLKF